MPRQKTVSRGERSWKRFKIIRTAISDGLRYSRIASWGLMLLVRQVLCLLGQVGCLQSRAVAIAVSNLVPAI